MMKRNNSKLCTTLLLGLALGACTPAFAQMKMPPATVEVEPVSIVRETDARKYVGQVRAIRQVKYPARVSGILLESPFKEGDMVKAGDLLYKIENTTYLAKKKAAEAKRDQIKAELEYAERNYARSKDLATSKVVSESAFEEATRLVHFMRARLSETEADLLSAENDLSYTTIYASISGRIGKGTYSPGNYVTPQSEILVDIIQPAPLYVIFSVSEPDMQAIFGNAENMKRDGVIRLRTADRKLYDEIGWIKLVDNKVDPETGTIKVWSVFDNKDLKLTPGGLVDAVLTKRVQNEMPAIRASAIMTGKDGHYVYILGPDNTVMPRPVVTGSLVGDKQVVKSGLKPGEIVIVDGTHKTMPGAVVIPRDMSKSAPQPEHPEKTAPQTESAPAK